MSTRVFIVDTNVLVAGLITAERQSPTAQILDAMLSGEIFYLLSSELAQEYRDVLLRPSLTRLHGLNETEIDQVMTEITANAIWRDPPVDTIHMPPDPRDAHLWSLLAFDPTAVLITGDLRLLENPRPQSSIISPKTWTRQFQRK